MPPSKMKTIYRFTHELEINRARVSPIQTDVFAARTDEGPLSIFRMNNEYPVHLMQGVLGKGFALEWSHGGILSGDETGKAYYWK